MSRRIRAGALVVTGALLLAVASCSASDGPTTPAPTPSAPAAAPTPTPTAEPEPASTRFEGGPVLAVKIDHVNAAYPRAGIGAADVVYVDKVEYGLTRLIAVFSTSLPDTVGPIRSARPNDPGILATWGRVPLAFSGASRQTHEILDATGQIQVEDGSTPGFHRDRSRRAPHNLFGNATTLLAAGGGSQPPNDIGFRYGDAPAGGTASTTMTTNYPQARMSATFNPATGGYAVTTNGRTEIDTNTGEPVQPKTVVVQKVVQRDSTNRVSDSIATPESELVGEGEAIVLREGRSWRGTWQRQALDGPTTFTTGEHELTFAPGPVWVWFVPTEQPVTVE